MTATYPFDGIRGGVQSIVTSGVSQPIFINPTSQSVRIVNVGTEACHIRIGKDAQVATTADTVVRANSEVIFRKGDGENVLAALQIFAPTTIYVQPGENGV